MHSFQNHNYRGDLTMQAHTRQDVFVQLPVGERAAVQTDEYEIGIVPAVPAFDPATVSPADKELFISWYEGRTGQPIAASFTTYPANNTPAGHRDAAFALAWVAEQTAAFYRAYCADYDMSQGAAHLLSQRPGFAPLNLDVRTSRRILAHYHDHAGRNNMPYLDTPAAVRAKENELRFNTESDKAYVLMLLVEYEELIPAAR